MQWSDGRIGFHLAEVNPIIKKYAGKLLPKPEKNEEEESCSSTRIFLPLCGKTVDLAYLVPMAGEVVGVEGIRTALEEFTKEQPHLMVENKGVQDGFERYVGNKISLLKGDFFDLDSDKTNGKFGAIYDRASMVAIQPHLRKAYIEVISKLIAPKGKILLVTLDRRSESEVARTKGPPFSIPEATVRELFEGLNWVESVTLLEESDQLERKPEDKERYPDLDQLMEVIYLIEAK